MNNKVFDCKKAIKSNEFYNRLGALLDEYRGEKAGLEPFAILDALISHTKIESCLLFGCYITALGMCTDLLHQGFEEMFDEIYFEKEEK